MLKLTLAVAALTVAIAARAEGLCRAWTEPETLGSLDVDAIPEASGIEISSDGSRLYIVNDGYRATLFVVAADGSPLQQTRIGDFRPRDIEDIALGPCGTDTCLFLADIGDNGSRRANVQIAMVEESGHYAAETPARHVVTAFYPDGPHDAEAIAVHPQSGDLVLVTKSRLGRNEPALVYRLRAAQLSAGGNQIFERLGEIPVSSLTPIGLNRRVVTAMDFAPDGRRLLLLTYDAALELALDLDAPFPAAHDWVAGQTHQSIPIAFLIQAESIAYAEHGEAIVYTTESVRGAPAPLVRQSCR